MIEYLLELYRPRKSGDCVHPLNSHCGHLAEREYQSSPIRILLTLLSGSRIGTSSVVPALEDEDIVQVGSW